jgi:hypothetical protein
MERSLGPCLALEVSLKCLLHLQASHIAWATNLRMVIHLNLCKAEVYGHDITVPAVASRLWFALLTAALLAELLECPGTLWIEVAMFLARRV